LSELKADGTAILLVTHDIEFAAETADRMALLFAGGLAFSGTPEEFCRGNIFYTTARARIYGRGE
ncbi:MAG: ABC transporter ATP-binding protein, partial [Butyrivibrio sp.]|nr:ABC transporter ATP-binding protein [Butyrivibrio sp.]